MHTRPTSMPRELATLAPHAAILGLMLVLAARGDARPGELLLAVGAVLVFQVVPGVLLWRAIRPVDGWLVEDLAMGFALGAAMAVPTQVLTVASGIDLLPFAMPVLVSALLLGLPATRARITSRRMSALPWWWGSAAAVSLIYPVLVFVNALAYPMRWTGFARRYVDLPFHEALVGELLYRFPLHYPHVAHEEVAYHWFAHAWTANIVALSGTPIDITLWRVDPALIHVAAPLLTAAVAMRISRRHWVGPLAALVAFLAPEVQPWKLDGGMLPLAVASPTQGFGVLLLPALIGILALRWRGELPRGAGFVLMIFVMVIAGGAKGTTVSILVPGLLLATVAMLAFDRRRLPQVAADAAAAVLVLVVLTKTLFAGAGESLSVQLMADLVNRTGRQLQVDAEPLSAVGVAFVALVVLQYGLVAVGLLAALVSRTGRRDPLLWTMLGCACAGVGALVVFSHPGLAQYYFTKTSLVPLGIGVACGIGTIAGSARRPSTAALVGAGAGVVGLAAAFAIARIVADGPRPTLGSAWVAVAVLLLVVAGVAAVLWSRLGRAAAALAAATAMVAASAVPAVWSVVEFRPAEREVASKQVGPAWVPAASVSAYRWLRDHSDPDDLVATNQHCAGWSVPTCSRRAFTIAAYTERRVLVEGWAYVPRATQQYDPENGITTSNMPYWDPELLALNDGFFEHPDREGAEGLRKLGVRWLVVAKQAPHAETLEPFARLRHESGPVDIYELTADDG